MKTTARFSAIAALEHKHEADTGTPMGDAVEAYGMRQLLQADVDAPYCSVCRIDVQGIDADLGKFLLCEYCGKELRRI